MFYPNTTLTLTLTPSHPYSSGKKASCLLRILWMASDSIGRNKAAVYRQYSYAALLVQLCCTFGIPMLTQWYQNALLFWYRFFNLFTDNIRARIRMKKRSSAAEGKANEELSAVGRLRNKVS